MGVNLSEYPGAYSPEWWAPSERNPHVPWKLDGSRPRTRVAGVLTRDGLHRVPSIHRIVETLHEGLTEGGYFVANERIGRNGHTSWPEALVIIPSAWRTLSPDRKQNHRDMRDESSAYLDLPAPPADPDGIR